MKPGDLIKWRDYTTDQTFVGLFIRRMSRARGERPNPAWADIVVLCAGKELKWSSWQCEVISGRC